MDVDALAEAVRSNQRAGLARAITLVESTRTDHRDAAQQLLLKLLPEAGGALRVGITGVPGVGKSTFIDALGMYLIEKGHRVAVLAVDPSSTRTGGSILGDKTRMSRLAAERSAYIRPSPTSGTLGGVAKATRETIVLLEAAGFDVILVETVGVGQSEVEIAEAVDTGFVKVHVSKTGRILGALIVGEGSGEMINEWTLAIQNKMRIHRIMMQQHSFPTMGFLSKRVAETWMMSKMKSKTLQRLCRLMYRLNWL